SRGVLIRSEPPGLFDGQLRSIPVGIFLVTVEKNAELVHAIHDLVFFQNLKLLLPFPRPAKHLLERKNGVIAGMVSVVARRPKLGIFFRADGEVIRDRDRLIVSDEPSVLRAQGGTPRSHARIRARLKKVDSGLASELVSPAGGREFFLVRSPPELRWLHA